MRKLLFLNCFFFVTFTFFKTLSPKRVRNTVPNCDLTRVISIAFIILPIFFRYDYVKISMGRRLLRRLTGSPRKRDKVISIKGTSEVVRVAFKSDRSVSKRGFFAKYNVMKGDSL